MRFLAILEIICSNFTFKIHKVTEIKCGGKRHQIQLYLTGVDRFEIINNGLYGAYTQLLGFTHFTTLRKPTVAMSYLVTIYFRIFSIDYFIHICEHIVYLMPNTWPWLI